MFAVYSKIDCKFHLTAPERSMLVIGWLAAMRSIVLFQVVWDHRQSLACAILVSLWRVFTDWSARLLHLRVLKAVHRLHVAHILFMFSCESADEVRRPCHHSLDGLTSNLLRGWLMAQGTTYLMRLPCRVEPFVWKSHFFVRGDSLNLSSGSVLSVSFTWYNWLLFLAVNERRSLRLSQISWAAVCVFITWVSSTSMGV